MFLDSRVVQIWGEQHSQPNKFKEAHEAVFKQVAREFANIGFSSTLPPLDQANSMRMFLNMLLGH